MLTRTSVPDTTVVDIDGLKQRLRIDGDDADDTLEALLRGETERYEDFTGRVMLPTEFELRTTAWSTGIAIPAAPVRGVTAVTYLDADDTLQQLDDADWYFEASPSGGCILFTDTFSSPALSSLANPVRVAFAAGHDDPLSSGSGDDPAFALRQSDVTNILLMVQRIWDSDEAMDDEEMRRKMGHRKVFR